MLGYQRVITVLGFSETLSTGSLSESNARLISTFVMACRLEGAFHFQKKYQSSCSETIHGKNGK
jgi:hypothetical protein